MHGMMIWRVEYGVKMSFCLWVQSQYIPYALKCYFFCVKLMHCFRPLFSGLRRVFAGRSWWLCSLALVFFEESCTIMYICCLLMHICVLVVCCSCFCSIQMHPRFHHFSSQRKAPAHLQFRAKTPEKATKVWIVCYLNKSIHHSSFFPRHTSQCASPNWPHFCPQRGHQSCNVNSLFTPSHSVVYLFLCGLNAMNCIALRGSARFCVELVIRGHKESPKMT